LAPVDEARAVVQAQIERQRLSLLGAPLDPVDAPIVERELAGFRARRGHTQVLTLNTDFIAIARRDERFRQLAWDADLVVPDGAPVLWAARRFGHALAGRVTGPDLIEMAVRHSRQHGSSLYFLGGVPGSAHAAADALRRRLGEFRLAGVSAPVIGRDPAEDARTAAAVAATRPDFVFVGLGCPKQEFFIQQHRAQFDDAVCVGVGGSFSYLSGDIKRAPRWAQRAGFEWLFRLIAQPRHLARRYFVHDLPIVLRLWREARATAMADA
jgi:N-acetylglucosaminyldiphosphoundecaprenol N-acetyl-beta-D-mannosaminyltransferase